MLHNVADPKMDKVWLGIFLLGVLLFVLLSGAGCGHFTPHYEIEVVASPSGYRPSDHEIEHSVELMDQLYAQYGLVGRDGLVREVVRAQTLLLTLTDKPFVDDWDNKRILAGKTNFLEIELSAYPYEADAPFRRCFYGTAFVHELTHLMIAWTNAGTPTLRRGEVYLTPASDGDPKHELKAWWQASVIVRRTLMDEQGGCDLGSP